MLTSALSKDAVVHKQEEDRVSAFSWRFSSFTKPITRCPENPFYEGLTTSSSCLQLAGKAYTPALEQKHETCQLKQNRLSRDELGHNREFDAAKRQSASGPRPFGQLPCWNTSERRGYWTYQHCQSYPYRAHPDHRQPQCNVKSMGCPHCRSLCV